MDSLSSCEPNMLNPVAEVSSIFSLIERGLLSSRRGQYGEGVAFFALAREQLSSDQMYLAPVLDAITQGHSGYWQAHETLLQASKAFARIDAEQQARLSVLENLLPARLVETDRIAHIDEPLQNARGNQSLQVRKTTSGNLNGDHFPIQLSHLTPKDNGNNQSSPLENNPTLPALYITCFSRFEVRRLGQPVNLCPNRSGQTILRYLMTQSGYRANMDMLMGVLWPEDEPEVARRKLQIAVSALRQSLNSGYSCEAGGGYILFKDRVYCLNTAVSVRSDVDEFLALYKAGQQTEGEAAASYYERACRLYTGPFLVEDLYADWSFNRREHLSQIYLAMCSILADHYLKAGHYEEASKWASTILNENHCEEAAHRQLIRIYTAQGRRNEALRQYRRCERVLKEELGVSPMPETVRALQRILTYEHPQPDEAKIERK